MPDGQVTVLLGPSGCGKSTLLRMIAGLETPSGGEVRVGGRVMNDVPPAERGCALVFQNYALYPHKTVRQNLAFPLRMAKVAAAEQQRSVDDRRARWSSRRCSIATRASSPAASASAWPWAAR
jgi:ABC-type sugar transport system ATPase subunit